MRTARDDRLPEVRRSLQVHGQIAHFQVQGVAGRGGMGIVYKAYDPSLDRCVALKLLRKDRSADKRLIEKLELEAAITATVTDPHVVRMYGTGTGRSRFYISME
jgi:serine/threonine protein kinase